MLPRLGGPGPVRCRSPADDVRGLLLDGMPLVVGLPLGRDRRPSAAARTNGRLPLLRGWMRASYQTPHSRTSAARI